MKKLVLVVLLSAVCCGCASFRVSRTPPEYDLHCKMTPHVPGADSARDPDVNWYMVTIAVIELRSDGTLFSLGRHEITIGEGMSCRIKDDLGPGSPSHYHGTLRIVGTGNEVFADVTCDVYFDRGGRIPYDPYRSLHERVPLRPAQPPVPVETFLLKHVQVGV